METKPGKMAKQLSGVECVSPDLYPDILTPGDGVHRQGL